jgi:hypothetical protein
MTYEHADLKVPGNVFTRKKLQAYALGRAVGISLADTNSAIRSEVFPYVICANAVEISYEFHKMTLSDLVQEYLKKTGLKFDILSKAQHGHIRVHDTFIFGAHTTLNVCSNLTVLYLELTPNRVMNLERQFYSAVSQVQTLQHVIVLADNEEFADLKEEEPESMAAVKAYFERMQALFRKKERDVVVTGHEELA